MVDPGKSMMRGGRDEPLTKHQDEILMLAEYG
jgi:hypothetical protein